MSDLMDKLAYLPGETLEQKLERRVRRQMATMEMLRNAYEQHSLWAFRAHKSEYSDDTIERSLRDLLKDAVATLKELIIQLKAASE